MGNSPILIVDDDDIIQHLLREALEDGGLNSRVKVFGIEAVALLKPGTYRLLIIDTSFGNDRVKGWPVAERARAFHPDIPIIYITGGSTDEWSVHGCRTW